MSLRLFHAMSAQISWGLPKTDIILALRSTFRLGFESLARFG
jgi:hypothetical protein